MKSEYIYGSYRKIKTGVPLFWITLYNTLISYYIVVRAAAGVACYLVVLSRKCTSYQSVMQLCISGTNGDRTKIWTDFDDIFGGVGRSASNNRIDFSEDPDTMFLKPNNLNTKMFYLLLLFLATKHKV